MKLGSSGTLPGAGGLVDSEPDSGVLEMIPPSVKERLLRLQHENKKLKASAEGNKSKAVLQVTLWVAIVTGGGEGSRRGNGNTQVPRWLIFLL